MSDTPPGIPPEHQARVFDRFYRVDSDRSRAGGAGLGPAICQSIVEAHGGSISVDSGPGARFDVFLPEVLTDHRDFIDGSRRFHADPP